MPYTHTQEIEIIGIDAKTGLVIDQFHAHAVDPSLYRPMQMWPVLYTSNSGERRFRVLLSMNDDSAALIQSNGLEDCLLIYLYTFFQPFFYLPGNVLWQREEALARAVAVDSIDLPLSESQVTIEEEFSTMGNGEFYRKMRHHFYLIIIHCIQV